MKKLMIAAAAAATVGGAFAAPQVYDMTITVKATECKSANKAYKNVCADDVLLYRAQTTQKFYGKFWGCQCAVIACPDHDNYGKPRLEGTGADDTSANSFVFWGAKSAFHDAEMTWDILQLVGKNGTNIEGAFRLDLFTCEDGTATSDPSFCLSGAGYGTASVKACEAEDITGNYIKSMSGNVVGTYNVSEMSDITGCKYCGEMDECVAWQFCDCVNVSDASAAFGTFTLKYNASQAKALAGGKWIDQANKFKSFVTDEFKCIAAGETPDTPADDAKTTAQKNYKAAKDALEAAEAALADLDSKSQASLQQAADDAAAAYDTAAAAVRAVAAAKETVAQKEADVEAAQAAVDAATTEADVATAKANLKTAQEALENANTAYANAKKAANAADVTAFETAAAAKDAADKALAAFDQTTFDAEKTAAEKAVEDAKDALDYAKIACAVAGADCK